MKRIEGAAQKSNFCILLLCFVCLIYNTSINAQVNINLRYPPLNQLALSDLWNLTITNTSGNDLRIYLEGTASESKDGAIVEGKSSSFVLKALETRTFTPNNIGSTDVKWKNNKYKEIILRTGTAPSGNYTICVYAKSEPTGSGVGSDCKEKKVEITSQITLISPDNGSVITEKNPAFTLLPPPGALKNITYSLKIVEILGGPSPAEAISKNTAFLETKDILATVLVYPVSGKNFETGKRYAWKVIWDPCPGSCNSEIWKFIKSEELIHVTQFTPVADTVSCTDTAYWNKIYYRQFGVAGNDYMDTLSGFIDIYPMLGGGLGYFDCQWHPYLQGYKKTLIGTLDNYHRTTDYNHDIFLSDHDFNLNVIPDDPFKYLLEPSHFYDIPTVE